jgi:hypothetical protein
MSNIFVGQYKDILKKYYKKQKEYNAQILENNKRFTPEYAKIENRKIHEQQAKAYQATKDSINSVFDTVKGLLARANFVNVENLTADRLLFDNNSSFDFSVEEVQGYVERYSNNFSMLRLIKDWIAKHDTSTAEQPYGKFSNIRIVMPVDMVKAYKTFADGAIAIADRIYGNGMIMHEIDDSVVYNPEANRQGKGTKREYPFEIEAYGNEEFSKELFDIVGTGAKLSDYKNSRVPETAVHAFDNITLADTEARFTA